MDRSFLSRPEVVAASRQFVCVRLTTYEDELEAKFSRDLVRTRSQDVENTSFALLAPDAKTRLSRTGRSARNIFTDAAEMAAAMKKVAGDYPAKVGSERKAPPLPVTLDARLGVDVAASDHLLLVAVLAADEKVRSATAESLAKLAWSSDLIGRFTYCLASKPGDFPKLTGLKDGDGILIIEPDTFGQSGKVLKQLPMTAKPEEVTTALKTSLADFKRTVLSQREHRALAIAQGAFWVPNLPVTDVQEAGARETTKRQIDRNKK